MRNDAANPPSGQPRQGECHRKGPLVFPVVVPGNPLIPTAQPEQRMMSVWPPTFANQWCAEYSLKTEGSA